MNNRKKYCIMKELKAPNTSFELINLIPQSPKSDVEIEALIKEKQLKRVKILTGQFEVWA